MRVSAYVVAIVLLVPASLSGCAAGDQRGDPRRAAINDGYRDLIRDQKKQHDAEEQASQAALAADYPTTVKNVRGLLNVWEHYAVSGNTLAEARSVVTLRNYVRIQASKFSSKPEKLLHDARPNADPEELWSRVRTSAVEGERVIRADAQRPVIMESAPRDTSPRIEVTSPPSPTTCTTSGNVMRLGSSSFGSATTNCY